MINRVSTLRSFRFDECVHIHTHIPHASYFLTFSLSYNHTNKKPESLPAFLGNGALCNFMI